MKKVINTIDAIFYHHLKRQEKDFDLNGFDAICAVFSFVGLSLAFAIIIFGLLLNWDFFYDQFLLIPRGSLIYIILAPYAFWSIFFSQKKYLSIAQKDEIYSQNAYKRLYKIWFWGTTLLPAPIIIVAAGSRFGF